VAGASAVSRRTAEIASLLDGAPATCAVTAAGRKLTHEGSLTKIGNATVRPDYFFLFETLSATELLHTSPPDAAGRFAFKRFLRVLHVEDVDLPAPCNVFAHTTKTRRPRRSSCSTTSRKARAATYEAAPFVRSKRPAERQSAMSGSSGLGQHVFGAPWIRWIRRLPSGFGRLSCLRGPRCGDPRWAPSQRPKSCLCSKTGLTKGRLVPDPAGHARSLVDGLMCSVPRRRSSASPLDFCGSALDFSGFHSRRSPPRRPLFDQRPCRAPSSGHPDVRGAGCE